MYIHVYICSVVSRSARSEGEMQAAAPTSQGSVAQRRCISSLQVTYHQEIHKPTQQTARLPYGIPSNVQSSYGSCGPVDQSLDVPYVQEDELEPSCQEQDFYPPPPPVPLCASQPAACSCSDAHDPPPPPMHTHLPLCDPHRFLFGLEDGLRQKINVEIENFRASVQEVMREQFTSHHHHPHHTAAPPQLDQPSYTVKVEKEQGDIQTLEVQAESLPNSSQNDSDRSGEISIDSGLEAECVEATPSLEEELSLALIRLQTLSAIISSNLQRAEYTSSS